MALNPEVAGHTTRRDRPHERVGRGRVMTTPKRWLIWAVSAGVLPFGCNGAPDTDARITMVFASENAACVPDTDFFFSPPPACALVSVCERAPGSPTCEPVTFLGMRGSILDDAAFVRVDASGRIALEIQVAGDDVDGTRLEVTTELYDASGVPTHRAIRTDVPANQLLGETLEMRFYPLTATACARGSDSSPEARFRDRAFHAATRLANGDVLIYGGVRGEAPIDNLGPMSVGIRSQPIVEIYRAEEDRVEAVDGTFSRVLFAPVLLTDDPDATVHRIYVAGGLDELGTLLRFDVNQIRPENFYGAPLLVGEDARAEGDVILSYDTRTNAISVEPVGLDARGAVAWDAAAGELVPVVGGVIDSELGTSPHEFSRVNAWIDVDLEAETTGGSTGNADRFGHSVTLLGDGSAFVWGGNLGTSDELGLESTAGQLIARTNAATDVPGNDATLFPTAFHTATRFGASEVLIAGGLRTNCLGTLVPCGQNGVTPFPADEPLTRIRVTSGGIAEVFAYPDQPFQNSIWHTMTTVDDETALMIGGSSCTVSGTSGCDPGSSLSDTDRIFGVTPARGAFNDVDDDLPDALLQGRFGHQVTRLDVCPRGASDCDDPRFLVTGGLSRNDFPIAAAVQAIRVAEVISMSRGAHGSLDFDDQCVLRP
jgi:hypothetical protein